MLDLAVRPLLLFNDPLNTIKLAPVTEKQSTCGDLHANLQPVTFPGHVMNIYRVSAVIVLRPLCVLYANQMGIGRRTKIACKSQNVLAGIVY